MTSALHGADQHEAALAENLLVIGMIFGLTVGAFAGWLWLL